MPRGGQRDRRAQGTGSRRNRTDQSQGGQSRAVPASPPRWLCHPLVEGHSTVSWGCLATRGGRQGGGGQVRPGHARQSCCEMAARGKRPVLVGDRCLQPVVGGAALPMGAIEHMGEVAAWPSISLTPPQFKHPPHHNAVLGPTVTGSMEDWSQHHGC